MENSGVIRRSMSTHLINIEVINSEVYVELIIEVK